MNAPLKDDQLDDTKTEEQSPTVGEDTIEGAKGFAAELNCSLRRATYLLETGQIPAGKIGSRWVGSKARLRKHYAEITGGKA